MLIYIAKRFFLALLVTLTVSIASFFLLHYAGDLALALSGEGATEEELQQLRRNLGLDRPVAVQYAAWLEDAIQGDFGQSVFSGQKVSTMIRRRLPTTLKLAGGAFFIALLCGIPLGVLSATRPNSWLDRSCLSVAVFGQSMPGFFLGLLLILFFGVKLKIMPISGADSWLHFVMPVVALSVGHIPAIMRLTRHGMIESLESDYIRTALAKGLTAPSVLFKHALRNAALPVIALSAVTLGHMLSGSVITESVFALDGVGLLAYESIRRNDFPVVQTVVFMFCIYFTVLTFASDMLNAFMDPRVRGN